MRLGSITTRHSNIWGTLAAYTPIVRADLRNQARIRSLMADDMRAHLAASGGVTHDDLLLIGWTAAQVSAQSPHAIQLARRRAGQDA
jgi:hypothetical protein